MSKYFNGDKLNGYEDSPITYVYGGNLEECHKVIADLEAKLAEKDTEIERVKLLLETERVVRKQEKKKLEKAKHDRDRYKKNIEIINKQHVELVKKYQIEFAVEKLKEVKKLFEEKYTYDVEESDFAVVYEDDVDEIIDNQIKQLKEGK